MYVETTCMSSCNRCREKSGLEVRFRGGLKDGAGRDT